MAGLKKFVPKLRSSSIIVSPAPIVGSTMMSIQEYVRMLQQKSGMRVHVMPGARMLWIVTMKLIAPTAEEIARMCRLRIQRSCPLPGVCNVESGT